MAAARERQRRDDERDRTVSWYVAALSRQEKLPPFDKWVKPPTAKRGRPDAAGQNHAQMRSMFYMLAEQYGLTVRPGKPKTKK